MIYIYKDDASSSSENLHPQFGLRWKIFELDACDGAGKVCLVFPPKSEGATLDEAGNINLEISPP